MTTHTARFRAGNVARAIFSAFATSTLCLAGCTNGPPVKSLRTPARADTITLNAETEYAVQAGLFGMARWTFTVQPGTYTAEKEDNAGTYFRLQGESVTVRMGDAKGLTWHHAGGIWVPRNANLSPRIYYFADSNSPVSPGEAGRSVGTTAAGPAGGVVGGASADIFLAIANRAEAGKISIAPEPADRAFASTVHAAFHAAAQ